MSTIFSNSLGPPLPSLIMQTYTTVDRLGKALLSLQLTISDKTTVVSRHTDAARQVAKALQRMGIPAKYDQGGLDCGVLFTGGAAPNKSHQAQRIHGARLRLTVPPKACKFDARAVILASGGVQPCQTYGAAALGTSFATARKMKSNISTAIHGSRAQPCPTTLTHSNIGPKHDTVLRIATDAIDNWMHLLRHSTNSTLTMLKQAWVELHWLYNAKPFEVDTYGPISGTIHGVAQAGWHPGTFNQWSRYPRDDPSKHQSWRIGRDPSSDAVAIQLLKDDLAHKLWEQASHHHSGDGLQQGAPAFHIAERICQSLRNQNQWKLASALHGAVIGTAWPNTRTHPNDRELQTCTKCGRAPETPWHRYWGCPSNDTIETDDGPSYIRSSNFLKDVLTNYPNIHPECLWAGAILPRSLSGAELPIPDIHQQSGASPHTITNHQFIAGYTDGAGFDRRKHPVIHRVGSGAFMTSLDDNGNWSLQYAIISNLCLANNLFRALNSMRLRLSFNCSPKRQTS